MEKLSWEIQSQTTLTHVLPQNEALVLNAANTTFKDASVNAFNKIKLNVYVGTFWVISTYPTFFQSYYLFPHLFRVDFPTEVYEDCSSVQPLSR